MWGTKSRFQMRLQLNIMFCELALYILYRTFVSCSSSLHNSSLRHAELLLSQHYIILIIAPLLADFGEEMYIFGNPIHFLNSHDTVPDTSKHSLGKYKFKSNP